MVQHILVVEDDVMIQGFLALTLENEGFKTSAVGSGSGMFAVLGREKIDLILLDLGLPDVDGMDLLKELREKHSIPVIVASARRRADDRDMAKRLGAVDFITKPFEPLELVGSVKRHLGVVRTVTPPRKADPIPEPDVVPAIKSAPKTARPAPPQQLTSVSAMAGKSDQMVLMLGVLVIVAAMGGGAYVYFNRTGDEDTFINSPKTVAENADPTSATTPVAVPNSTVSSQLTSNAEPDSSAALPESRQPITQDYTESVVVQPEPVSPPSVQGGKDVTPLKSKCALLPDVSWWRIKTHAQIIGYVEGKHGGDWSAYVENWSNRLKNLQGIFQRGSAVKTGNGVVLKDESLAAYVNQVAERLAITKCLADEALERRRR